MVSPGLPQVTEARIGLDGVVLNGYPILEGVPPDRLHEILGPPDRIVDPATPAPFGHHNNHIHVYDFLGLYFHEHHYTRLAEDLVFVFWAEEQGYRFSPRQSFSGCLHLNGYRIPVEAIESDVLRDSSIPFERHFRGNWRTKADKFSIGMCTKGARLKSGRRNSRRRVVRVRLAGAFSG
jgi:hypothetical protein